MSLSIFRPKYINKPFSRLPLKQRAIFVLHLAGFTQREIAKVMKTSLRDVNAYVSRGISLYKGDIGNIFPKGEEI